MGMARLKEYYRNNVIGELTEKFDYRNVMQVPKLGKMVVNIGLGESITNAKILESGVQLLNTITGQRPVVTRAKKSIAGFRLREGMAIGSKVTLRGDRMFEFYDRLVNSALPRVRDFKGVSEKGFDGRGNYSLGIREQIIFPEVDLDDIEKLKGLGVVIVTTAKTDEESKELLRLLGMPFRAQPGG
jgi:large subunit ribosomal protein L5